MGNRPQTRQGRREGWALVWMLLGLLWGFAAAAAQFVTTFDHESVDVGETTFLNLTFEDLKVPRPPQLPAITNANISYIGPQSSFVITDGQATSSVTHRFAVTPQAPGEVRVPPMSVTVGGQTYTSRPLVLKVSKGGVSGGNSSGTSLEDFVYLKIIIPREEVFYGESFQAEVRLYTALQVRELNPPVPKLGLDGFVIGKNTPAQQSQVVINNRQFAVLTWKMSATAAKLGVLNFGPAEAEAVIQVPTRGNRRRDPFGFGLLDDFFGGAELRRVELKSSTNVVKVVPLPAQGRPAEFSGGVGRFKMDVDVSSTNVAVGEPVTLRIQISGTGNLESLGIPQLADTRGWKSYPPTTKVDTTDPLGLEGTKTFELVLEPESAALKSIPEIRFTYFDPETRRYQTLKRSGIPIIVRPSATAQAAPSRQAVDGEPMTPAGPSGEELVHIRSTPGRWVSAPGGGDVPVWWYIVALFPLPAYWIVSAVLTRREAMARDPARQRRLQAMRAIESGRAALQQQAAGGDSSAFFTSLTALLQERIGLTLGVPAAGITEEVVDERLRPKGLDPASADTLAMLFERINQARYAPVSTPAQLEELRRNAEAVCDALAAMEDQA